MLTCSYCGSSIKEGAKFCSSCGKAIAQLPRQETALPSSAKVVKHPMSKQAKTLYSTIALVLFGIFIFIFYRHLPGGAHPVIERQPEISMASMNLDVALTAQPIEYTMQNGKISFSLSLLREKKMISFDYHTDNRTVPLLAFISAEGKLVTAIRLCEPCNSMNFRIEGNELACNNCETRWKLDNLEGIQGTCQKYPPDPIPSEIIGNFVVIDEAVIKNWKIRI